MTYGALVLLSWPTEPELLVQVITWTM